MSVTHLHLGRHTFTRCAETWSKLHYRGEFNGVQSLDSIGSFMYHVSNMSYLIIGLNTINLNNLTDFHIEQLELHDLFLCVERAWYELNVHASKVA